MNDPTNVAALLWCAPGPSGTIARSVPLPGTQDDGDGPRAPETCRSDDESEAGDPLEIVRQWDRATIARFVLRNGRFIRMRLRDRLRGKVRSVFDSEDLVATVARRMDGLAEAGFLRAESDAQMWALMVSIAEHAASEYGRRSRRDRKLSVLRAGPSSPPPADAATATTRAEEIAEARAFESNLSLDRDDHVTLRVRLTGGSAAQIGAALGASTAAVRMRCIRLRAKVVDHLPEDRHGRAKDGPI